MTNFHNPIEDLTLGELQEACLFADLVEESGIDALSYSELSQILEEYNAEIAASDFYNY